MNKIIITGRLTTKPNSGVTSGQVLYSRFTIACQRRSYGNNQDSIVDFLPCVAWRYNAEFANKYLDKGSLVLVEGSLQASRVLRDGVVNVLYSINVDSLEALETKKYVELRKQNQEQETEENKTLDLNETDKKLDSTPKDTEDLDDEWSSFTIKDI